MVSLVFHLWVSCLLVSCFLSGDNVSGRITALSGKSTLLSNLAGVYSEVAAYEFTTLTTVPGCIKYKVQ